MLYAISKWSQILFLKNGSQRTPGWLSRLSIQLLISAQVMIPGSWDEAQRWAPGWVWGLLEILSLPLSAPLVPPPILSVSKIKEIFKNYITKL